MGFFAQQALNGLILGSVFALFALGYSLVLANLRIFNVAHEGVFTWGALGAYWAVAVLHLPFLLGIVASMLAGGLVNVIVYLTMVRHLHRRANEELAAFISTLGGLIVLTEFADVVINRTVVRLPFDVFPVVVWHVGFVAFSSIQLFMAAAALGSFFVLWLVLERTQLGREIKTVAFDRELGSLLGIDIDRVTVIVFALSGIMAGLAAILISVAFNVIEAQMGSNYGLMAIAITVIGGFGSLPGALVAGLLLGFMSSMTTAYLTTSYRDVVVFGFMLLILLWRPRGLFPVAVTDARA
jgi:branched-chain amino acid transport system permease protein